MKDRGFYIFALIAAILSAVSWVTYVATATGSPAAQELDAAQAIQALADVRLTTAVYGWSGLLGALLTVVYIVAFQYAFRELGPWFWLATTFTIIGSVLTALGFMAGALAVVYFYLPMGLAAAPEEVGQMWAAIRVTGDLIEVTWFVGSFLAYGIGIGLFAMAALRSAPVAKWINWVGIVGAIAGIAWLTPFVPALEPFSLVPRLVNILGLFIWSIALAVAILRNQSRWD